MNLYVNSETNFRNIEHLRTKKANVFFSAATNGSNHINNKLIGVIIYRLGHPSVIIAVLKIKTIVEKAAIKEYNATNNCLDETECFIFVFDGEHMFYFVRQFHGLI